MSVTITTDIFCDTCPCWIEGVSATNQIETNQARRHAKSRGWAYRKVDGKRIDVCPGCKRDLDSDSKRHKK